jgi:hypothetical protein
MPENAILRTVYPAFGDPHHLRDRSTRLQEWHRRWEAQRWRAEKARFEGKFWPIHCLKPNCESAILSTMHFPGATQSPQRYFYGTILSKVVTVFPFRCLS